MRRSGFSIACVFGVCQGAVAGGVVYVDDDAPPGGDGSTWATAHRFLQEALPAAVFSQIRVAQGVYYPDRSEAAPSGSGDRESAFALQGQVAILGGYAGIGAPDPDARDVAKFVTVLSGDLLQNDGPGFTGNDENAYHVVRADGAGASGVLDGVTITAGHASESNALHGRGAGARLAGGAAPTITNCRFVANRAWQDGAGLHAEGPLDLTGCSFEGNSAHGSGGGVCLEGAGAFTIVECVFELNEADNEGGGVATDDGQSVQMAGCTFSSNAAVEVAAALACGASTYVLTECTFDGNTGQPAIEGSTASIDLTLDQCLFTNQTHGTVMIVAGALEVSGCDFIDNATTEHGGAIRYGSELSSVTITSTTFDGNVADDFGGAVYGAGTPQVETLRCIDGCQFTGNGAERGGAIAIDVGPLTVTGCGFDANTAEIEGGAIWTDPGDLTLAECTFSGNEAGEEAGALNLQGSADISACLFDGNTAGNRGGAIEIDDLEVDVSVSGCAFTGNSVGGQGGALWASEITLTDTEFSDNAADRGGAAWVRRTSDVTGCRFERNAADRGAGLYVEDDFVDVLDCTFVGNVAADTGGGLYMLFAETDVTNCLFVGNGAATTGGAVFHSAAESTFTNCTVLANTAAGGAGGVHLFGATGIFHVSGSVVWGNTGPSGMDEAAQILVADGSLLLGYSCVQGLTGALGGTGNIGDDPLFVATPDPGGDGVWGTRDDDYGDAHLGPGSPCVDAGDNPAVPIGLVTDLDGLPRFVDDPDTPDTGNPDGFNPIVDMGCYEAQFEVPCPADVTGDGTVGVEDLVEVILGWGDCPAPPDPCPGDVTGDRSVGVEDLVEVVLAWGPC